MKKTLNWKILSAHSQPSSRSTTPPCSEPPISLLHLHSTGHHRPIQTHTHNPNPTIPTSLRVSLPSRNSPQPLPSLSRQFQVCFSQLQVFVLVLFDFFLWVCLGFIWFVCASFFTVFSMICFGFVFIYLLYFRLWAWLRSWVIVQFCGWEFVWGFAHLVYFAHWAGGELCNHGVGSVSFARKKKTDTVLLPIQITCP